MSSIIVIGTDPPCGRCKTTEKITREAVKELGLNIEVKHISIYSEEAKKYDVLITPAVVINDKVVISGKVPSKEDIKRKIKEELKI